MRRVVIDLGCLDHNDAHSLATLAAEYKPALIYGFDPSPDLEEGKTTVDGVPAIFHRKAAWISNGELAFTEEGWSSRIDEDGSLRVRAFDFSRWLRRLRADEIIVKMDIERAEFPVLKKMIADGTDRLLTELLIEWHGDGSEIEAQLHCPVRHWWM